MDDPQQNTKSDIGNNLSDEQGESTEGMWAKEKLRFTSRLTQRWSTPSNVNRVPEPPTRSQDDNTFNLAEFQNHADLQLRQKGEGQVICISLDDSDSNSSVQSYHTAASDNSDGHGACGKGGKCPDI